MQSVVFIGNTILKSRNYHITKQNFDFSSPRAEVILTTRLCVPGSCKPTLAEWIIRW